MTITTLAASQLRITYRSKKCPKELQLSIDGVPQTGQEYPSETEDAVPSATTTFNGTWEFYTTAVLEAGSHTLQFIVTDENGFADPALVDVWLTTVVV